MYGRGSLSVNGNTPSSSNQKKPVQPKSPLNDVATGNKTAVVRPNQKQRAVAAKFSPRTFTGAQPAIAAVIFTDSQGRFLSASTAIGNPLDFVVLSSRVDPTHRGNDKRRRNLPTAGTVPTIMDRIASNPTAKKLFNDDQFEGAKTKLLASGTVPKDKIESRLSTADSVNLNGRFLSPAHAVASGIWDYDDCHDDCHHHHHRDYTKDHHTCHEDDDGNDRHKDCHHEGGGGRRRGKKSWHRKCAYDGGGFWEKCGVDDCFHRMHCLSCGHHHDEPYNPYVIEKPMGNANLLSSPGAGVSSNVGNKTRYEEEEEEEEKRMNRRGRAKYRRPHGTGSRSRSSSGSGRSYSYSSSRSGSESASPSRSGKRNRRHTVGAGTQNLQKIGIEIDVKSQTTLGGTSGSFSITALVKRHIEAFASTFWNDEKEDAFRVTHDCENHANFSSIDRGEAEDDNEDEDEDDKNDGRNYKKKHEENDEEYEGETYFEKCMVTEEGKVIPVLDGKNACSFCSKVLPETLTKINGAYQCDQCGMAVYCSPECHEKDWNLGGHEKSCKEIKKIAALAVGGSNVSCDYCSRREQKTASRRPTTADRDLSSKDDEETELQGEDESEEEIAGGAKKSFFESMASDAVAYYVNSNFSLSDPVLSFISVNEKGKLRLRKPWTRKQKKNKPTTGSTPVVRGSSTVTVPSGTTTTTTTTEGVAKPKKKSYFSRFKAKVRKVPGKLKRGFESRRMGYSSEETNRLKEEIASKNKTLKGHQAADLATKRRMDAERRQRDATARLEKAKAEESRLAVIRGSPSTAIVPGTTTTVTTTTRTAGATAAGAAAAKPSTEDLPSYMRGHIGAEWTASAMTACLSTLKKLSIDPKDVGFSFDESDVVKKSASSIAGAKGTKTMIAWNGGGPGAYPANPRYAGGGGMEYYQMTSPRVYSNPYANSYALRRPVVVTQGGTVRPYASYYGRHPATILPGRVARLHAAHNAMMNNYPKLRNDPVWTKRTNTIIKFWPFWWPWIFFITPPYYASVQISDQMWENEEEMKKAIREIEEDERYRGFVESGYRVVPNFTVDPPTFSWVAWSQESKHVAENTLNLRNSAPQSQETLEWERSFRSQEGPPSYFDTGDY